MSILSTYLQIWHLPHGYMPFKGGRLVSQSHLWGLLYSEWTKQSLRFLALLAVRSGLSPTISPIIRASDRICQWWLSTFLVCSHCAPYLVMILIGAEFTLLGFLIVFFIRRDCIGL